jgi:hypothetical protein
MSHPRESEEWKAMTMRQARARAAPPARARRAASVSSLRLLSDMRALARVITSPRARPVTRHPPQRYEFFAPIWRVMRDDNVTVDGVAEQVGGGQQGACLAARWLALACA